jgi:hypothetical protein
MAKKKSDKGLFTNVASFTGHVAGSVEGAIEAAVAAAHHFGGSEGELLNEDVRSESSDVRYRGVLIGGAGLLVGMWLATGLLYFYFAYLKDHRAAVSPPPLPIAEHGAPLPPEPRLQGSPAQDLITFRAKEDWELTHYYWLDKNKGVVAIPIEQAIEMTAQRGIPPQKTPPNPTLTPPEDGTRLTGFEGKVEPEPQ